MDGRMEHVPDLVKTIYAAVDSLSKMFPGTHFTPDGHMVSGIGKIYAAYYYDLQLLEKTDDGHCARTTSGMLVQVKTTQGTSVVLQQKATHLIVLHLNKQGLATEIYNGPGDIVWKSAGKEQRNGRPISVSRLK